MQQLVELDIELEEVGIQLEKVLNVVSITVIGNPDSEHVFTEDVSKAMELVAAQRVEEAKDALQGIVCTYAKMLAPCVTEDFQRCISALGER